MRPSGTGTGTGTGSGSGTGTSLAHDALDHLAVDEGEAFLAAQVRVGELILIET